MLTAKRWIALAVAAAVLVLLGGWFLVVAPKHAEADALAEQKAAQDASNAQLTVELEVLRAKQAAMPQRLEELEQTAVKLPAEPRLPDLLRALSAAAVSAGVELVSVAPGAVTPVTAPAPAPAPAPAAGAEQPAAPAPAPAPAPAGVSVLPLTISVVGQFYDVEAFVAALEEFPRALRLTALTLSPHEADEADAAQAGAVRKRPLTSTLTGEVYVVTQAPGVLAAPAAVPPAAAAPAGTAPAAPATATTASGSPAAPPAAAN